MTNDEATLLKLYEEDGIDELVVEEGEWISNGKYQYLNTIVKYNGKHYKISQFRSGSYHTDWDYGEPSISQVVPVEVTITKWKEVK